MLYTFVLLQLNSCPFRATHQLTVILHVSYIAGQMNHKIEYFSLYVEKFHFLFNPNSNRTFVFSRSLSHISVDIVQQKKKSFRKSNVWCVSFFDDGVSGGSSPFRVF